MCSLIRIAGRRPALVLALAIASPAARVAAQPQLSVDALAKASQNPLSNVINVPVQMNFLTGGGYSDGTGYDLSLQPIVPIALSRDWSLVSRTIVPYWSVDAENFRESGVGDIQQQFFVTPARAGEVTWGVGPMFNFPTARNDQVHTGAWAAGPAGMLVRNTGNVVMGALAWQLWTFADWDNELTNIGLFNLQPFVNVNFNDGWALNFAPIIEGNWTAPDGDQWTVPLGLGFSKVTAIGAQGLVVGAQYYRNVLHPRTINSNQFRLIASFLYPGS